MYILHIEIVILNVIIHSSYNVIVNYLATRTICIPHLNFLCNFVLEL